MPAAKHATDADCMDTGRKPDKAAILAGLRARIRGLEGTEGAAGDVLGLGVAPVDAALAGGGLPLGCLHEVLGAADDGAATGFIALLLARLAARAGRSVLWLTRDADLHAPGLAGYGLTPDRLVLARGRRPADLPLGTGGGGPLRRGRRRGRGGGVGRSDRQPAAATGGGGRRGHHIPAAPPRGPR